MKARGQRAPGHRPAPAGRPRRERIEAPTVKLGALAAPLRKQLRGRIPAAAITRFQLADLAITVLRADEYLSLAQANRARDRLAEAIADRCASEAQPRRSKAKRR